MSKPSARSDRPTKSGRGAAGVRSGFEVYTPAARGGARAGNSGGDGHDYTRGRALWEDNQEGPRLPKGDQEWKRDRWDEDDDRRSAAAPRRTRGPSGRDPAESTAASAAAATAAATGSVAVEVPSGEQYEDISRRVEEEVVAKLARAQMMGMMLKAHREQENEESHHGARSGGGGGGRRRRGDQHNRDDGNWDRASADVRDQDHAGQERSRGRARGPGGGGGNTAPSRQFLRRADDTGRGGGGGRPGSGVGGGGSANTRVVRPPPASGPVGTRGNGTRGQDADDRPHRQHQPIPSPRNRRAGRGPGAVAGDVSAEGFTIAQDPRTEVGLSPRPVGMLRVPLTEVSGPTRQPGGGGGGASDAGAPPEDLGADPDRMSVEEAYAVIGRRERQHKMLLEDMRKDAGLVAVRSTPGDTVSVSGPAAVATATRAGPPAATAGLSVKMSRVRGALIRALGSLVRRDGTISLRKKLPNRLWMAHYRELEIVQHRLRHLGGVAGMSSAANGSESKQQQQQQALRRRLFSLIEEAERNLGDMVEVLETQIASAEAKRRATLGKTQSRRTTSNKNNNGYTGDGHRAAQSHHTDGDPTDGGHVTSIPCGGVADGDCQSEVSGGVDSAVGGAEAGSDEDSEDDDEGISEGERGTQQALQAFLTNLGDLARYRALNGDPRNGNGGGGRVSGWERAEALYRRAMRVDPSSGKVWNQLAVLSSCRGDNLEAFYSYLRGVCAIAAFPGGRESLLVLHEKCKARLSTLREATALDALGLEEHQARFRLYLLGACGTCLSRVDLGTFDGYLALAERHMVCCLQLHLMGPAFDAGPGAGLEDGANGLEGTLVRAIILCVCTASASYEGWCARGMEGGSWTQDAATSRAVRLCLSLAGSLAGLHRKTSKRGWEKLTAAGVCVFLDWLTCRPQFGEGARGTRPDEFQRVMACVVEFTNGVVRAAAAESAEKARVATGGNAFSSRNGRAAAARESVASEVQADPDELLWEDEECRGLPALQAATERRARKARKSERSSSQQQRPRTPAGTDTVVVDPWLTRVARLRKQTEFCVERGWIARGNHSGTYTLPKPPSRFGSSPPARMNGGGDIVRDGLGDDMPRCPRGDEYQESLDLDVGLAVDDRPVRQGAGGRVVDEQRARASRGGGGNGGATWAEPRGADSGGGIGRAKQVVLSPPSSRQRQQPRVPLFPPGQRDSSTPIMTPTVAAAAAVATVEDTMVVDAPEGDDTIVSTTSAMSSLRLRGEVMDGRVTCGDTPNGITRGDTAAAALMAGDAAAAATGQSVAVFNSGGGGSLLPKARTSGSATHVNVGSGAAKEHPYSAVETLTTPPAAAMAAAFTVAAGTNHNDDNDNDEENMLPDGLLGIVMAGLGSPDESLCAYCCATLSPQAKACSVCRTPAPAGTEIAPPSTINGGPPWSPPKMSVPVGSGGGEAAGGDELSPPLLQPKPAAQGTVAPAAAPVPAAAAAAAAPVFPAGVLAVSNLAEVMASSQMPQPASMAIGGGGGRGGNRTRERDPHNPSAIARAGLGDGGGGGAGRGGGGVFTQGGKMFGWPRGVPRASALPLVVIDVPNVAMRHGLNKKFSCKGVQMAMEYFRTAGHRVLGFLPDYYLDEKRTNGLERAKRLGVAEVRASRLPDDVQMLMRMVDDGLIIATPPQDYDDSYCIKYAMARSGYVVTNDLYRDHVKGIEGRKKAEAARRWIKSHSISYTFVGDEFFPNPDFSFQQDQG